MSFEKGHDFPELLRKFINAYESKDIDTISEMFSTAVVLRDWNTEVVGKDSALKEFARNFRAAESLKISIKEVYVSESGASAELKIIVDNSETLNVVDVITFDSSDKIISIIAYKGI